MDDGRRMARADLLKAWVDLYPEDARPRLHAGGRDSKGSIAAFSVSRGLRNLEKYGLVRRDGAVVTVVDRRRCGPSRRNITDTPTRGA